LFNFLEAEPVSRPNDAARRNKHASPFASMKVNNQQLNRRGQKHLN